MKPECVDHGSREYKGASYAFPDGFRCETHRDEYIEQEEAKDKQDKDRRKKKNGP